MKRKMILLAFVLFAVSAAANAQHGTVCSASPENPTAVLALVGSAAGLLTVARNRFFRK